MRRVNKLAAAVALALSAGVSPQVFATLEADNFTPMHIDPNKEGDALIFPVFVGQRGIENYFTISNSSNSWIQGHLRLRGAGWSGELTDLDVILSPGDVFVFRVADVDGDGWWEIDQSLDPDNFDYTDFRVQCFRETGLPGDDVNPANAYSLDRNNPTDNCLDAVNRTGHDASGTPVLTPKLSWSRIVNNVAIPLLSADDLRHHLTVGYVEFIGEGVLDNLGPKAGTMRNLLTRNDQPNQRVTSFRVGRGVERLPNQPADRARGTTLWEWTDASARTGYPNNTLSDVPNVLSGTAFIAFSGQGHGLAYNAESIVNFRTTADTHTMAADNIGKPYPTDMVEFFHNYPTSANAAGRDGIHGECDNAGCGAAGVQHRLDTYPPVNAVILHQDDCAHDSPNYPVDVNRFPAGINQHYIYSFREDSRIVGGLLDEGILSYNNTCGPTMADGDDYNLSGLRGGVANLDDWDLTHVRQNGPTNNSIGELEEAIRQATTTPRVKHNGVAGQSFKSFYFDGSSLPNTQTTLKSWYFMLFPTKFIYGEDALYWGADTRESNANSYLANAIWHMTRRVVKPLDAEVWNITEDTVVTGCANISPCPETVFNRLYINQELALLNISTLKSIVGTPPNSGKGRVAIKAFQLDNNWPRLNTNLTNQQAPNMQSLPFLLYAFEHGTDGYLSNWRSWHRNASWDTNSNYGGDILLQGQEASEYRE